MYPQFGNDYARARELQAETFADQVVTIADECEDANHARVRVDARKWAASKILPKKYGERQTVEHEGSLNHFVVQVPASAGSIDEWLKSTSSSGAPAPGPSSTS